MSWVICPVKSPFPPIASQRTTSKPPRPGSFGATTSTPPPLSCSPFSGKSSSKMNADRLEGMFGVGCENTVTLACCRPVFGSIPIGAPPMPWPQCPNATPAAVQSGTPPYAALNGFAASPGSTEM